MMQRSVSLVGALAVLLWPLVVGAQPISSACRIQAMTQDSLAPADLTFPIITNGEHLLLTIDEVSGEVTADFGALPIFDFPNTFSQNSRLDTLDFQDEVAGGTIDAGGNIVLSGVRGINCTQGKCPIGGPPCPCIPGNLCSNDVTRVCVDGGTGDLACPPVPPSDEAGVCQGVCSNDRTRTCASTVDCTPPGFCGEGVGMRLDATFATGAVTFEGFTLVGSGYGAFTDGIVNLVSIHSTPPETFAIGDIGVSALAITCTLDPTPTQGTLPPAAWVVKKGLVKLGKGAAGDGDDKLTLKATFAVEGGEADFASDDLSITLATDDGVVVTLTIPASSFVANSKGTKFKLVDRDGSVVTTAPPPPDGFVPSHKINVKKGKTGVHTITLASKNLDLDGLDAPNIITGVALGAQTPSERAPVKAKGSKRSF